MYLRAYMRFIGLVFLYAATIFTISCGKQENGAVEERYKSTDVQEKHQLTKEKTTAANTAPKNSGDMQPAPIFLERTQETPVGIQ